MVHAIAAETPQSRRRQPEFRFPMRTAGSALAHGSALHANWIAAVSAERLGFYLAQDARNHSGLGPPK